jgi:Flp pilus assembly protein protease CpaA
MMEVSVPQWGVALGASLAAAIMDMRQRRIPNVLTLPLIATGLLYGLLHRGLGGLGEAVAGCALLMLPYVLLFIFAGGGAGDAKMMGGIGAWLGLRDGIIVLAAVAVTGAVFGLINIALKGQLRPALARIGAAFYVMIVALCSGRKGWQLIKPDPDGVSKCGDARLTMPYGPAIFVGVCIGAFLVHSWK